MLLCLLVCCSLVVGCWLGFAGLGVSVVLLPLVIIVLVLVLAFVVGCWFLSTTETSLLRKHVVSC